MIPDEPIIHESDNFNLTVKCRERQYGYRCGFCKRKIEPGEKIVAIEAKVKLFYTNPAISLDELYICKECSEKHDFEEELQSVAYGTFRVLEDIIQAGY